MEEGHKPLLDKYGSLFRLASSFLEQYCVMDGIDMSQKPHDGLFNLEAYNAAKPLFIDSMGLLKAYAQSCRYNEINGTYNGMYGWYDKKLGATGTTPSKRWTQDISVMMELLPNLRFLVSHRR
jgi:hypothetical protein